MKITLRATDGHSIDILDHNPLDRAIVARDEQCAECGSKPLRVGGKNQHLREL